ncbi:Phage integrase family protein [Hespellia stercorisuis DSM 15480]|uniref:Phage integrase family protein n=1 Tax=Hespellia stercorisuis DSM 15480 TaxID=1121950 RepID=A0A1M6R8N4_9FIRM|nr:tyrosine-type recombinase/integrase [Hespellia stercorisuis]SHK28688.1 Phage integrase family protein [Hespellia stercorisuis DSM 15480]
MQPTNIKKIHDIIRCALNQAIGWEYLDTKMRNPASLATLPTMKKVKRKVWKIDTFKEAVRLVEDDLLLICMHLAFSCSMRIGEITGLTWEDVIIDEESINNNQARVIINKELSRVSVTAMQKLKEKDIIKIFPTLKPHCTTRLVLKIPKTETSNRIVWLPKTVALLLVKFKEAQQELKEFLGDAYNDYNLVVALENGNPVESRIVRDRFQNLCEEHGFEVVVFHSLRHLSTGYKLKMTGGDIKSVQGDTGHAEAEMVTEIYSEVIDEDRRYNAQKMDEEFYGSLNEPASTEPTESLTNEEELLLQLLKAMSPEMKEKLLKQSLNA